MQYIEPSLIRHGAVAGASALSIILPMERGDVKTLVVANGGRPLAILLQERPWHSMFLEQTEGHSGVIVEDVQLEIDFSSIFDCGRYDTHLGCALRGGEGLYIRVLSPDGDSPDPIRAAVYGDLPRSDGQDMAFTRWRIVKVIGDTLHVLHSVNATAENMDED